MVSYLVTAAVSFVAGVVVTLLFARRNKNKIDTVNRVIDAASAPRRS